jgi:4-diphosphocytidyl-2-C-methyl-D-erythritol kinase
MTGSGACVFAAFDSEDAAQQALSRIPRVTESTGENAGETAGFVARALNRHPLWSFAAR